MQATVIPFQRSHPNAPDYTPPAIEGDWADNIASTASDERENLMRIRKAKALLNLIEHWGDSAFDDIASELQNRVIEPAEDAIRETLRSTAIATCSERDECEVDDLVHGTSLTAIMREQRYRRPSPRTHVLPSDFGPLHWAEVLTGLPLIVETTAPAVSA